MHFLDFFAIVERERDILNPISAEKLERVARYAGLRDGLSVLDIGSGKAAMLRQWTACWNIRATGLELNPAFVAQARALTQAEGVTERLTLWEGKALEFVPEVGGYDVVTCLGALFALGSFTEAAQWMRWQTKAGGAVVLGDVYLRAPAPDGASGEWGASLPSLEARSAEFQSVGLELVGLTVAATDDWDHYSSLMWSAVSQWAAEHPHHLDRPEVLQKVEEGRKNYLRWERNHLGWAVWVGRR